jgi:hypothetical protein
MRDSPSAFSPTKQNKIQIVSETKRNREREGGVFEVSEDGSERIRPERGIDGFRD